MSYAIPNITRASGGGFATGGSSIPASAPRVAVIGSGGALAARAAAFAVSKGGNLVAVAPAPGSVGASVLQAASGNAEIPDAGISAKANPASVGRPAVQPSGQGNGNLVTAPIGPIGGGYAFGQAAGNAGGGAWSNPEPPHDAGPWEGDGGNWTGGGGDWT